jgi:hypothetical protein
MAKTNYFLLNFETRFAFREFEIKVRYAEKCLHYYMLRYCNMFFLYFFGGLECVGHSFAYFAHLWFLWDAWIRTQSAAVANWRATDLATHPYNLATNPPF